MQIWTLKFWWCWSNSLPCLHHATAPTSTLFPTALLFKESLITSLTIFLHSTSFNFLYHYTQTAHAKITNDLTALNPRIFSLCLTWVTDSIWHNWPTSFLKQLLPQRSPTLLMSFPIGFPLSAPPVNCRTPDLRPRISSSGMSFSFMGLNTTYILSTPKLRSRSLTFP